MEAQRYKAYWVGVVESVEKAPKKARTFPYWRGTKEEFQKTWWTLNEWKQAEDHGEGKEGWLIHYEGKAYAIPFSSAWGTFWSGYLGWERAWDAQQGWPQEEKAMHWHHSREAPKR